MNTKYSFNLIRIDLKDIHTIEEIKQILINNEIKKSDIDPEKLFRAKSVYDTLFFDSVTLFLVAFIAKSEEEIHFVSDFLNKMKSFESINNKSTNTTEFTLDNILDKINSEGFKSLTEKEKNFLDDTSKK